MRIILYNALFVVVFLSVSYCTETPPEAFLTPEFEEVTVDDTDADGIRIRCKMSSMTQLTEYGLDYTDDWDNSELEWKRIMGSDCGNSSFEVQISDLERGETYCFKLFVGNGKDVLQSPPNYFTILD